MHRRASHARILVAVRVTLIALGVAVLWFGVAVLVMLVRTGAPWPEAIPPTVQFDGTDYQCEDRSEPPPSNLTVMGVTLGGGAIMSRPPVSAGDPPAWVVVAHGSATVTCLIAWVPMSPGG
jgi:hypothetical protein